MRPERDWWTGDYVPDHDPERWQADEAGAHPFEASTTPVTPGKAKPFTAPSTTPRPDPLKEVRTMTKQEREAAPPPLGSPGKAPAEKPPCEVCGKQPISHRGRTDHPYKNATWKPTSRKKSAERVASAMLQHATRAIDSTPQRPKTPAPRPRQEKPEQPKRVEPIDKVKTAIALALEINQMSAALDAKIAELEEMLA